MRMSHFVKPVICVSILCGALVSGCKMKVAEVQSQNEPAIENGYLGILDELTAMMRDRQKDPGSQLETLRVWVTANRERVSGTIHQLNQDVLEMSPEAREAWRSKAMPELEKRLDAYSKAQLSFQKRLNATQKWELGEILSQLK